MAGLYYKDPVAKTETVNIYRCLGRRRDKNNAEIISADDFQKDMVDLGEVSSEDPNADDTLRKLISSARGSMRFTYTVRGFSYWAEYKE